MEFDLEYKLQLFREEQPELFDENNERYTATPIGKHNGEIMLQLINELESALLKAEQKTCNCNIPHVSNLLIAFLEHCEGIYTEDYSNEHIVETYLSNL